MFNNMNRCLCKNKKVMFKFDVIVWGEVEIGEFVWFEELYVYCLVFLFEGV